MSQHLCRLARVLQNVDLFGKRTRICRFKEPSKNPQKTFTKPSKNFTETMATLGSTQPTLRSEIEDFRSWRETGASPGGTF